MWSPAGRARRATLPEPRRAANLWGRLQANDIPAWLERVSGADRPFHVYRVKSGETG